MSEANRENGLRQCLQMTARSAIDVKVFCPLRATPKTFSFAQLRAIQTDNGNPPERRCFCSLALGCSHRTFHLGTRQRSR